MWLCSDCFQVTDIFPALVSHNYLHSNFHFLIRCSRILTTIAVVLGYVYPTKLQTNLYTEQPDEGKMKRNINIDQSRRRERLLLLSTAKTTVSNNVTRSLHCSICTSSQNVCYMDAYIVFIVLNLCTQPVHSSNLWRHVGFLLDRSSSFPFGAFCLQNCRLEDCYPAYGCSWSIILMDDCRVELLYSLCTSCRTYVSTLRKKI